MVTTAKHLLTGLLVSVTLAAPESGRTVRDEALNFEFSLPKELDWERSAVKPKSEWKAHFETYDAAARTAWKADVQLLVRRSKPKASLKEEAKGLRSTLEKAVTKTSSRRTSDAKLDGEPCIVVDVVGDGAATRLHLTWRIARRGPWLYVLFARRANGAIGDAVLEKEIARIVGTFRFLRPEALELAARCPRQAGPQQDRALREEPRETPEAGHRPLEAAARVQGAPPGADRPAPHAGGHALVPRRLPQRAPVRDRDHHDRPGLGGPHRGAPGGVSAAPAPAVAPRRRSSRSRA